MKKHQKFDRRERSSGGVFIPAGRGRALDISGQWDTPRCPLCGGPMTARVIRRGPYFHCQCYEKASGPIRGRGMNRCSLCTSSLFFRRKP